MKTYYYSPLTKGFYLKDIHGDNIPPDSVEITEEEHKNLLEQQSNGKEIVSSETGKPIAINSLPISPTWEQIRIQRNILLSESDWAIMEDANPKPSKQAWLDYRQALRNIPQNFTNPEDVIWPQKP